MALLVRVDGTMQIFEYAQPAELYVTNCFRGRRHNMSYQRFETAAKAIRYVVEELSPSRLAGTVMEVNERRHHHKEICALYESDAYPLRRRARKVNDATQPQLPV